ncbi:MAG TPA: DMT family transporter [Gemmatales bacterium]|nr:DMT family transporter [Gemmatales bacterium]HMP58002.1 DMT family transporter [Gemmatales bacterium]
MTVPSPGLTPPFPYAGEVATLTAAVIWACTLSIYRLHGRGVSAVTLNWFKNTVALFFIGLLAAGRWIAGDGLTWPQTDGMWSWLVLSGVVGFVVSDTALFAGLRRVGAQLTSALQSLVPPVAALLAWLFMGENLTEWGWWGMGVTLVAVMGVIRTGPGAQVAGNRRDWGWGIVWGLVAAVTQAIGFVIARHALQHVDLLSVTLVRLAPAVVLLFPLVLVRREDGGLPELTATPGRLQKLTLAAICGGGIGLTLLAVGTKYVPVGVTTTLGATLPIWVIPVSYLLLGERARPSQLAWTCLAVFGVALLFVQG